MGRISLNLEFPLFYYQIRSVYGILYQKYLLISRNLCNEVNVQEEELSFIVRYNLNLLHRLGIPTSQFQALIMQLYYVFR